MTAIDPATMGDIDRLVDMWLALASDQRAHGSRIDPAANDDAIRESLAQHVLAEGVLVARDGDDDDRNAIVGFVMFGPDEAGFQRDHTRGVVRNVFVVPDARGEGVGTALMDAAEARLADGGAGEVVLEAMADNDAARRFYSERGYEPHRVQFLKPTESDTHTS